MFKSDLTTQRKTNGERLLNEYGQHPYTHGQENISKTDNSSTFKLKYGHLQNEEKLIEETVTLCGRIMLKRDMGNLCFITLEDDNGRIQLLISKKNLIDMNQFKACTKLFDIGDIIRTTGYPMRTQKGELSLASTEINILTKALSPLPEKFHGLTDIETKYRQRYLDMISNQDVAKVFKTRSKIISLLRRFLEDKDYIEVETPVLNNIPGGANAKPFVTHHNALGQDRYLRIAPELYLKRLLVGNMERVFEIGKNFRNEGIDATHNPEFTSVEFYAAYIDYIALMDLIESLLQHILGNIPVSDGHYINNQVPYGENTIDFNAFARIPFKEALVSIGNVPEDILDDKDAIIAHLKANNVTVKPGLTLGKLWEELFDEFVEDKLVNPTFIIDYPTEISPLARKKDDNPHLTERFELFIAGKEIANGFNELNDPEDQYERFKAQVASKESDDEAMHMDKDFVQALMQGMPPCAGAGIGIDRLVMLLTNQHTIKDVIIFPAMKNN